VPKKQDPAVAMVQDLARIEAECYTRNVIEGDATKLFLFDKDALYVFNPDADGKCVCAAEGFGNVVAAAAIPGEARFDKEAGRVIADSDQVAAITSCGTLPSTGNVWSVLPEIQIRSEDEWGKSKAAFPIVGVEAGVSDGFAVLKDDKLFSITLSNGKSKELANEMEDDIVMACQAISPGCCFAATSTSSWSSADGDLWLLDLANGKAIEIDVGSDVPWGDTKAMTMHDGKLYAFGAGGTYVVRNPDTKYKAGAGVKVQKVGEDSFLNREDIIACCSDDVHGAIFAAEKNKTSADTLWKLDFQKGYGSGKATAVEIKGGDVRNITAMVAVNNLKELPATDFLCDYQGESIDADKAEEIFSKYDRDNNGVIDTREMKAFWRDAVRIMAFPKGTTDGMRQEAIANAVERTRAEFDMDKNGLVSKEEFLDHLQKMGVVKESTKHEYFKRY